MFEKEKLHILDNFKSLEQYRAIEFKKEKKQKFIRESNKIKKKYNYLILRLLENERKKIWVGLGEFEYDSESIANEQIEKGFEAQKNSF